jgi:hypothetical protein
MGNWPLFVVAAYISKPIRSLLYEMLVRVLQTREGGKEIAPVT